jgi:hypothetical protein
MKKTLLIAAAALAAGVISSQAQVYSQNIVGYVNQTFTSGQYVQISIPLQVTSTNAPEDVFPALQTGDAILLWNGTSYQTYTYFSPGQWLYPNGSTIGAAPNLPVGTGLFFLAGNTETNTYVGTVQLSNTNAPVQFTSGNYALVGSIPPIGTASLEDTNLNLPLQTGDAVLLWNGSSYQTYTYFSAGQWLYPNGSTIGVSPGLSVGEGFFYLPGNNETWSQNLQVQ